MFARPPAETPSERRETDFAMADQPRVILSGFADEAANNKTAVEQFAAFAALGLQYYSIRFVDLGDGVKNVMQLSKAEINKVRQLQNEYGLNVSSIGSPIGKVKLEDVDDGTKNAYVPFNKYLGREVQKACDLAHAFETKLIRGFSFYHPKGKNPRDYLAKTVDHLAQIAEACHRSDLTFGLEVEANLVGQEGHILAEIHRQVNHPAMVLIFDGANIVVQGYSQENPRVYLAMKPGLGWRTSRTIRTLEEDQGWSPDEIRWRASCWPTKATRAMRRSSATATMLPVEKKLTRGNSRRVR